MGELMEGRGEQGEKHGAIAMVVVYLRFVELYGEPGIPSLGQGFLVHRRGREGG